MARFILILFAFLSVSGFSQHHIEKYLGSKYKKKKTGLTGVYDYDLKKRLKDGTWFFYEYKNNDTILRHEVNFLNRKKNGYERTYYYNGSIESESYFINGKPDSTWTEYNHSGDVVRIKNYSNGLLNGEYTYYFGGGRSSYEVCTYLNGKCDGLCKWCLSDGTVLHQTEWKNGERNGAYIEYYSDGKIKVAGQYYPFEKFDYITSLQNRTGEWKYWNIDGELIKTETWENAKLVSLHEYISSNPFSNSPDTTQLITLNCFGKYCLDTDIKTYGTKCENSYVGYKHDIIYHFYKGDSLDHIMLTPSKEEPEIIQQMLTTSNRFRTEKGIGIGSTIEEIIQSGENVLIRNKEGSNSIYLYFPDLNLVAALDDDTKMLFAFSGLSLELSNLRPEGYITYLQISN